MVCNNDSCKFKDVCKKLEEDLEEIAKDIEDKKE